MFKQSGSNMKNIYSERLHNYAVRKINTMSQLQNNQSSAFL